MSSDSDSDYTTTDGSMDQYPDDSSMDETGDEEGYMMYIEPDSDLEEVGSQYDSCYSSGTENTATLFSEVTNYNFENGRRYHAYSEGHYWAPNDEKQNQQLEIFHHIHILVANGKHFQSPISHPKNILDLGTGTGIWAIEIADRFADTNVLGNDLSPVQPTWIPANCSFEVDDFTRPWLHKPGSFDLIFSRSLYGCVNDWSKLLSEALNALEPGGWFESVEVVTSFKSENSPDGELPKDSIIREWCELGIAASAKIGLRLDIAGEVGGWMERVGFVNVQQKEFKVPFGAWPEDKKMKTVGKMNCVNILEGSEGFTLALFTRQLGWSADRVTEYLKDITTELKESKDHLWYGLVIAYGQKPINTDVDSQMHDTDSGFQAASFKPRLCSS